MGCDIHLHVEVRRDGKWTHYASDDAVDDDPRRVVDEWGGVGLAGASGEIDWELRCDFDVGRNYALFAMLSGVRDYGGGTVPVAEPRGVPDDASPETAADAAEWDADGHTHSWLTLAELDAYDWCGARTESGLVPFAAYVAHKESGAMPDTWCQGTNMPVVTTAQADEMLRAGEMPARNTFVEYTWQTKRRDDATHFVESFLPSLRDVAKKFNVGPEDVRIVFWFDN